MSGRAATPTGPRRAPRRTAARPSRHRRERRGRSEVELEHRRRQPCRAQFDAVQQRVYRLSTPSVDRGIDEIRERPGRHARVVRRVGRRRRSGSGDRRPDRVGPRAGPRRRESAAWPRGRTGRRPATGCLAFRRRSAGRFAVPAQRREHGLADRRGDRPQLLARLGRVPARLLQIRQNLVPAADPDPGPRNGSRGSGPGARAGPPRGTPQRRWRGTSSTSESLRAPAPRRPGSAFLSRPSGPGPGPRVVAALQRRARRAGSTPGSPAGADRPERSRSDRARRRSALRPRPRRHPKHRDAARHNASTATSRPPAASAWSAASISSRRRPASKRSPSATISPTATRRARSIGPSSAASASRRGPRRRLAGRARRPARPPGRSSAPRRAGSAVSSAARRSTPTAIAGAPR